MLTEATLADIEVLKVLIQDIQDLHCKIFPKKFKPFKQADTETFFKEFLENKDSTIIIAHSTQKEPVGYIAFSKKSYKETAMTLAYKSIFIEQISVLESHQGKGFGKKLIQAAIDSGKESNIDFIELDVWSQNNLAREFFEKLGFKTYNEKMSLSI